VLVPDATAVDGNIIEINNALGCLDLLHRVIGFSVLSSGR
jgi:hypothetical protein